MLKFPGLETYTYANPNARANLFISVHPEDFLHCLIFYTRLRPAAYTLKHRKYGILNLNTPFRLGKIDNNATVELIPNPSASAGRSSTKPVRVAIQTPERKRVQGVFPRSATLWNILEDVDAEHKSNLVARTNVSGFYMVPAVTVATTRRGGRLRALKGWGV
eukprot:1373860-Amorphochlora_amoeboformis.AAC.2